MLIAIVAVIVLVLISILVGFIILRALITEVYQLTIRVQELENQLLEMRTSSLAMYDDGK